jgi:hypothetical protein
VILLKIFSFPFISKQCEKDCSFSSHLPHFQLNMNTDNYTPTSIFFPSIDFFLISFYSSTHIFRILKSVWTSGIRRFIQPNPRDLNEPMIQFLLIQTCQRALQLSPCSFLLYGIQVIYGGLVSLWPWWSTRCVSYTAVNFYVLKVF